MNNDTAILEQHLEFAGDICIEGNQKDLNRFADIDPDFIDLSEEEKAIISEIQNLAKKNASIDGIQFKKVDKQEIGQAAKKVKCLDNKRLLKQIA